MTAETIIQRAVDMLGFINEGDSEARYRANALSSLNAVYADLHFLTHTMGFKPATSVYDEIDLEERLVADVMPYGVAAWMAQAVGDTDSQQYFSAIYNQKRKAISTVSTIEDTIPGVD